MHHFLSCHRVFVGFVFNVIEQKVQPFFFGAHTRTQKHITPRSHVNHVSERMVDFLTLPNLTYQGVKANLNSRLVTQILRRWLGGIPLLVVQSRKYIALSLSFTDPQPKSDKKREPCFKLMVVCVQSPLQPNLTLRQLRCGWQPL